MCCYVVGMLQSKDKIILLQTLRTGKGKFVNSLTSKAYKTHETIVLLPFQMSMGMSQSTDSMTMSDPNGYHQQSMYQDHSMGLSVR